MHTIPRAERALHVAAVVLALASLSCSPTFSPSDLYVPVISNQPDSFSYRVTLTNHTQREEIAWFNTGIAADVNLMSTVTGGTATIAIRDAEGAQVYSHAADGSGVAGTVAGMSGTWTIVIVMSNTTGTLNFQVQKI